MNSTSIQTNTGMLELTAASCVYLMSKTTRALSNIQEPQGVSPQRSFLGVQSQSEICVCALTGFLVLKSS